MSSLSLAPLLPPASPVPKARKRKRDPRDFDEKYLNDPILEEMRANASSSVADGEGACRPSDEKEIAIAEERAIPLRLNPLEGHDDLEEEISPDPNYCFFCACSSTKADLQQSVLYTSFKKYVEDHWGWTRDPIWLVTSAQNLYNTGIREHTPLKLPFYKRMIFEHFLSHEGGDRFDKETTLVALKGMKRFIEKYELFKEKVANPEIKKANWPAIDRYLKICQYSDTLQKDLSKFRVGARQ
jgi:hypothetical protein